MQRNCEYINKKLQKQKRRHRLGSLVSKRVETYKTHKIRNKRLVLDFKHVHAFQLPCKYIYLHVTACTCDMYDTKHLSD